VNPKEICAQIWAAIHYSISSWKIHLLSLLFIG